MATTFYIPFSALGDALTTEITAKSASDPTLVAVDYASRRYNKA